MRTAFEQAVIEDLERMERDNAMLVKALELIVDYTCDCGECAEQMVAIAKEGLKSVGGKK